MLTSSGKISIIGLNLEPAQLITTLTHGQPSSKARSRCLLNQVTIAAALPDRFTVRPSMITCTDVDICMPLATGIIPYVREKGKSTERMFG